MSTYSDLATSANVPLLGREADMVPNNAGGFTFSLDAEGRLLRFLILGADAPTYYASKEGHFKQAYEGVLKAISTLGPRAVEVIADVSERGRAPKQDAAVFALALAVARGDAATRAAAIAALPRVCRIPTHLFSFLSDLKALGGKTGGRALRRALQQWYLSKPAEQVAYHMVKYRQRGGWTHRDVLRLCKPPGGDTPHGELFAWATGKNVRLSGRLDHMKILNGARVARDAGPTGSLDRIVTTWGLPHEAVPDTRLSGEGADKVWRALLRSGGGMPLTALLRNLGRMTAAGTFRGLGPDVEETAYVCGRLMDKDALRAARVHPLAVLTALRTYERGYGVRGALSWEPNADIISALGEAFVRSFEAVEATGLRHCVGLDVSGSMTYGDIAGVPGLTPREASAALTLMWAKTEQNCLVKGFSTTLTDLTHDFKEGTLGSVCVRVDGMPFGATAPSLLIEDALKSRTLVDVFVVLTDNEVNAGKHPKAVLDEYRRQVNPNAKLVVVGMTATEFTLADPNDPGMLDVVGFDTAGPAVIAGFAKG
jgi:60 kDa SS-A/Ro ribonucleoprotein